MGMEEDTPGKVHRQVKFTRTGKPPNRSRGKGGNLNADRGSTVTVRNTTHKHRRKGGLVHVLKPGRGLSKGWVTGT